MEDMAEDAQREEAGRKNSRGWLILIKGMEVVAWIGIVGSIAVISLL